MGCPKTLLVLGHPGHELRVWQWLCDEKPVVCILTDGSGGSGTPRLNVTLELLKKAGALLCDDFEPVTDARIYQAILSHDMDFFLKTTAQIRDLLVDGSFEAVVGDGSEGYNPTHDVCRLMIDAASASAALGGHPVLNYAFPLMGHPRGIHPSDHDKCVNLSESQWQNKIDLIVGYGTQAGGMLDAEVADTFDRFGKQAFQQEWLFLTQPSGKEFVPVQEKPFYESHGEKRVAEGAYRYVIRYSEHIDPIRQALLQWANGTTELSFK